MCMPRRLIPMLGIVLRAFRMSSAGPARLSLHLPLSFFKFRAGTLVPPTLCLGPLVRFVPPSAPIHAVGLSSHFVVRLFLWASLGSASAPGSCPSVVVLVAAGCPLRLIGWLGLSLFLAALVLCALFPRWVISWPREFVGFPTSSCFALGSGRVLPLALLRF